MPESYDPLQGYAGILSDIFKFVWTAMPFILRYPSIREHNCNIAIVCARDAGSTSETIYSKHKTACCISLWKFTVKTSLYFNPFYFRAFLKCSQKPNWLRGWCLNPFYFRAFLKSKKGENMKNAIIVSIPFISGLSLNSKSGSSWVILPCLNPFYFRAFLK